MDWAELVRALPSVGTGIGLLFAIAYAVKGVLERGDEWQRIVAAQKEELDRKDARIAVLEAERDERHKG